MIFYNQESKTPFLKKRHFLKNEYPNGGKIKYIGTKSKSPRLGNPSFFPPLYYQKQ